MVGWPIPNSSTPTECPECGRLFAENRMLQAEARMELARSGESAAKFLIEEALEDAHMEHLSLFRWN